MNQPRNLSTLSTTEFDTLIIGGGISGAWLALHSAQQGYKTALIEKRDYASQTSSSSSKLLHSGIRYLQQLQFGRSRESAMERAEYIYAAPHLSMPVRFIVPTYKALQKSKFFLGCGMLLYRLLCIGENNIIGSIEHRLQNFKFISAKRLNQLCDLSNEKHTGGVVFSEQHMHDSERMVLAILQTARQSGAVVHNYVSAQDFVMSGDQVIGAKAKDELSGITMEIRSKLVINAAGPWIDSLNSKLKDAEQAPSINGFAVGSHVISKRQICDHAIAITTKQQTDAKIDRGGRHMFIIPWRGHSLIGTSYDDSDAPEDDIKIQSEHVDQLIDGINQGMPSAKLTRNDLVSGYSGLYDLQTDKFKSSVYQGSAEYQVIDHSKTNGVGGLITALGAKFTTGRKLSALTMKIIGDKLDKPFKLTRVKLHSSMYESLNEFTQTKIKQYEDQFSATTIRHLIVQYGSQIDQFIERIAPYDKLRETIFAQQEDLFGQVVWAIEQEQAVTLNDVVFNRTSLGLLGIDKESVHKIAALMAEHLNWSQETQQQQLTQVLTRLRETQAALKGGQNQ